MADDCVVSGIVFDGENEVKPNALLTVTPIAVTGALVHSKAQKPRSDEDGEIAFTVIQGAQYNIRGDVLGFTRTGVNVVIPNSGTADLLDIISPSSIPSEGILIYDEGIPFSDRVGSFNFTGSGITANVVGGVAVINIPGSTSSVFEAFGDMVYADEDVDVARLPGNTSTTRKFLRQQGDGLISAAPAWDTFLSADITSALGFTPENAANKATGFGVVNDTLYPTVQAVKTYADALVVGLLDDRGNYDASSNVFPSSGGSGTAGAVLKGDLWYISVGGTLGGTSVSVGSSVRALVDSPGQTAGNWDILDAGLGYIPENVANKATSFSTLNNTLYPTTQAVANYAQQLDSDLTAIAGLTPSNDDVIQRKAGAWTNRTMAQLASDLGVAPGGSDGDYQVKNGSVFAGGLLKQSTNIVEQRNGANTQKYYLFGNYIDSSNYRRIRFEADDANAIIVAEAAGSLAGDMQMYIGLQGGGQLNLRAGGNDYLQILSTGILNIADGSSLQVGSGTGTKIGTATGQKIGFWGQAPVVQQVLATGAGATVDNVISALQGIGLFKQS